MDTCLSSLQHETWHSFVSSNCNAKGYTKTVLAMTSEPRSEIIYAALRSRTLWMWMLSELYHLR